MLRLIRWTATALIILLMIGWGAVWLANQDPAGQPASVVRAIRIALGQTPPEGNVTDNLAGIKIGGPFSLEDPAGHPVTDTSFRGRWMLVYFGYTYCPDVCPTELQAISAALDRLGPDARQVAPIFVTVDPERDTPSVVGEYVKLFDERLIGLTGTPQQIHYIAQRYRVYYAKVTTRGASEYLMDHSSFLYLMGPDGSFRALLHPGETPEELAAAISSRIHA